MKNHLYRLIINDVTISCYQNCLELFSDHATILDVGIGNGSMIENYHALIKSKGLKIIGIDINKNYLDYCVDLIRNFQLKDNLTICHQPVEAYTPPEERYFDFILFSMSFMLLNDQAMVLDRITDWLKPGGQIVFFQTIFKERFPLMAFIKPKLKYVTTVDFGKITYEEDFFALLKEKKIVVLENRLIKRKWFKGEYRMIASRPENISQLQKNTTN